MVLYRRNYVKGGTYFFTVNLKNRQSTILIDFVDLLRESFAFVQQQRPYTIIAIVIHPEHLHCIWQLPEDDDNYPARWKSIKSRFTRHLKKTELNMSNNRHGEYNIWQKNYWEHTNRNEKDLSQHIDYNPVKHGWVNSVVDWPHSSFHKYVKKSKLPANWGSDVKRDDLNSYGEHSLDAAQRNQGTGVQNP